MIRASPMGTIMTGSDWAVIIVIAIVGLNILWVEIDEDRELKYIRDTIREFDERERKRNNEK